MSGDSLIAYDKIPFPYKTTGLSYDQRRKRIWISTRSGLWFMNLLGEGRKIEKVEPFPVRAVYGVLIDHYHQLWISSNRGIIRYNPESKNKDHYFLEDGLQDMEFVYGSYSILKNGALLFGGVNGITWIDPDSITQFLVSARPGISKIEINDKVDHSYLICNETKATNPYFIRKLILPYSRNTISFNFADFEYSTSSLSKTAYRFFRSQDDIEDTIIAKSARFPDLREGSYQLEVYAINADGIWNPEPHRLMITINPPWFRSNIAIVSYFLLALLLAYMIFQWRFRRIKHQLMIRQQMAEFETAVLRLQMNPHFIFNSLNSVRNYINKDNLKEAENFLLDFSRLMRKILNLAALQEISLYEEIELLKEYLSLEQRRFQNQFNFNIQHESSLDPDDIALPTMILQPFVENSIIHGLTAKKGKGMIWINFWREGSHLFASVKDNGIGRNKGKVNNQHISKSTEITLKRLSLLEKKYGIESVFRIEDLMDSEGKANGTLVIIGIPTLFKNIISLVHYLISWAFLFS